MRNQFLSLFFRLFCLIFFISNFPFLCYLFYFHYPLLSWLFLLFSFFLLLLFLLFSFLFLFLFLSSSFYFYYPNFLYFSLYCLPHFLGYLVIFTSPIVQSISELWQTSYGIILTSAICSIGPFLLKI